MQKRRIYVDIKVKKLGRATKFYKDVLGLKLLVIAPNWTSLQANEGTQIHLNPKWGATAGLEFRVKNIAAFVMGIRRMGVHTSGIHKYSWGKIAHFKDSEGNALAVVED